MSSGSTVCRLVGSWWEIDGDAHVKHRVVTCLPLAERGKDGVVRVPATSEQSRELMWIRQRYPMQISKDDDSQMRKMHADNQVRQMRAATILSEAFAPLPVDFAEGLAPRWYQSQAAELWKSVGGLLLADDLGLGKTISTMAALADPSMRPCAIIVPTNLDRQWVRVAKRFLPKMTTHIIKSTSVYDLRVLAQCPSCDRMLDSAYEQRCKDCCVKVPERRQLPEMIVCSYNKLDDWADALAQVCKSVVFEEAHHLRRDDSKKWAAASELAARVNYRLGLTATPLFNLGGEIWNLLECIRPGFLGPKAAFKKNFCGYATNSKEPPLSDPEAMGSYLRESNVMLRRTSEQVGVKKGQCNIIPYEIEASLEVFNKHVGRAEELARKIINPVKLAQGEAMRNAAELDRELRKATGLAKAPFVAAFIELLLEQGIPVLCFAWHHMVHDLLCEKLSHFNPVKYTGEESKSQKDAAFEKFTRGAAEGGTDLMVASLWSGEGLDGLQFRCSTTVFAELDWSHSRMMQCIGRLHRDGQESPVNAYVMRSEFGLDPVMCDVLDIKKDQLVSLIGEKQIGPDKKIDRDAILRKIAEQYLKGRRSA